MKLRTGPTKREVEKTKMASNQEQNKEIKNVGRQKDTIIKTEISKEE